MQELKPVLRQKNMTGLLVIKVSFLLDRYHGTEWPPSPRRLFLALVAALHQGDGRRVGMIEGKKALSFLESRQPPSIYAPDGREGCKYTIYVPNNDMDLISSKYGTGKSSPKKPENMKTGKQMSPYIVDGQVQYSWEISADDNVDKKNAEVLCRLAAEVPVLGLGIDPVAMCGQVTSDAPKPEKSAHYIPDDGSSDATIQVPTQGLLENAEKRHKEFLNRLADDGFTKPVDITRWKDQRYRRETAKNKIVGFKLNHIPNHQDPAQQKGIITGSIAATLVEKISELKNSCMDGVQAGHVKTALLPSIGSRYADMMIRRAAFIVPCNVGESLDSIDGRMIDVDKETYHLEKLPEKDPVLGAYAQTSRFFASVTPVKIGQNASKREDATRSILDALKREGIEKKVTFLGFQKNPYWGTHHEGLYRQGSTYAEVEFESEIDGPFMLGDDQEHGYGLFAPKMVPDVAYFKVIGRRPPSSEAIAIGNLMRRAAMSKMRSLRLPIPEYISGHDNRRNPLREGHKHAFWLPFDSDQDGFIDHIAVYAKNGFDHVVRDALNRIVNVYDGKDLDVNVVPAGFHNRKAIAKECPLFGKHKVWRAATPYFMPWHTKSNFQRDAQLKRECKNRHYQNITVSDTKIKIASRCLSAKSFQTDHGNQKPIRRTGETVVLSFEEAVRGPIALGFGCHFGLGMFVPETP